MPACTSWSKFNVTVVDLAVSVAFNIGVKLLNKGAVSAVNENAVVLLIPGNANKSLSLTAPASINT